MARTRTIVGIGEALRAETPDRIEPAGAALLVPMQALRLGHRGIPISRIGQDAAGEDLATMLRSRGLDLSHVQFDPDHPTGRLKVQAIGRLIRRSMDPHSAFDELQWDFDLSDVAPVADAIVCGQIGCRSSQARTVIERFLDEAPSALKLVDLTNLPDTDDLRGQSRGVLERADVALVDEASLRELRPASSDAAVTQLATDLCRALRLVCVAIATTEESHANLTIVDQETIATSPRSAPMSERMKSIMSPLACVTISHALLAGWTFVAAARAVVSAWSASATSGDPDSAISNDVLCASSGNGAGS